MVDQDVCSGKDVGECDGSSEQYRLGVSDSAKGLITETLAHVTYPT